MKDTDIETAPHQFDSEKIAAMDIPTLDSLIGYATQMREQKLTERMAKLQEEAHALGASVKVNGRRGRRRKPKHHDD